ncbi:RNA polymerase Rpc34 subunit-domain-containing protein [Hysterangium stoloniferum]|nr:RNA polymerase Rpc34 subunit-domain-containing protein [Hysterangium stoloniferum]
MAPAVRPLNAIEQKIHLACSSNAKKTLSQKEIDALVPDVNVRIGAINFLLSTGMVKMMQDEGKQISYKAVAKKEIEIKKEMGGDENMVLNHIQSSGNEGIWTKHLKGKTELHQTIINRCLKSLEQKGLIKAIKSVKYPTRKIYMMSHLEPSVEVTGGPWYSENELDTEFIKMLTSACLRFIQDKSYPKSAFSWEDGAPSGSAAPLYPISRSSSYPTAKTIHSWLQKSRLSEQELGVEHVEMLLDVLVYDGEIERLPAYGAGMWDMGALDDDSEEERKEKRRKKEAERKKKPKGKKRSRKDSSDDESDVDTRKKKKRKLKEESDDSDDRKRRKKGKQRKKEDSSGDESESESDSDNDRKKSKKRKSASKSSKSSRSKSKSRSKKRSRSSSSESESESESKSESESESESDASDSSSTSRRRKKRSLSKSRSKSKTKAKVKSKFDVNSDDSDDGMTALGGANVYRAIRHERVSLGWSQAPCGRCPVFDFCNETGPVNPKECTYYGEFLQQGFAEF